MAKKKLFISYRRDNGDFFSELLYSKLNDEYDVFLDHHSLGSGYFSQKIKHEIHECDVFLLVLSKDALKYRKPKKGEEDVYKQEIKYALELKKKIVPIELKDFEFPKRSHGFSKEIKKIKKMQHFFFTDLDYIEPKIERLRQKFIDNDSSCFEDQSDSVENENEYKRLCWIIILILFWITLSVILACLLIPLFYDDPNVQAQGTVGGLPQSTSGETFDQITDVLAETTEHQTEESTREAETSTNNGTENEGNTEETIEESTENEPETEEVDSYRIQSFLIFGKAGTMSINETFLFSGKTNSPIVKLYIIYPEDKWQELKTIIVEDGTFSYEMQGASKWQDATHIAVVPYDGNGIELRENALLREVDFQCENPLYGIRFIQEQYGTEVGRGVNFSWSVPQNVEGNISFELMIVDKEKFEYNIIDPLLDTKDIKGNFCSVKASDMVDIAPGEYMIMLLVRSDKYPNAVVTTFLKVFEN